MQSGQIEVNGMPVSYVDDGSGEPVVFLHGAVSDLRVWEAIRDAVAKRYRFVAPTLRYFGTAEWLDKGGRFSVAAHADDIAAFIEAMHLGPVHLVGWSYGGNVATAVALEHPDVVRSLILFEPAISSMVKEGEAGDAASEAQGKMFGPVRSAVDEGDAEKATVRWSKACSSCRQEASRPAAGNAGIHSTTRGPCRCCGRPTWAV